MFIRVRSFAFMAGFAVAACSPDQTTNPNEGRPRPGRANAEVSAVADAPILYQQTSDIMDQTASPIPVGTTIFGDDFVVPSGQVWTVKSLVLSGNLTKASLPYSIRADDAGHPGTVLVSATQAPTAENGESCCAGVSDYLFDLPTTQVLSAGTYWIVAEASTPGPSETFAWRSTSLDVGSKPQFSSSLDPTGWATIGESVTGFTFAVLGTALSTQTITFDPSTPNVAAPGTSVALNVTASSGLPVSLTAGPLNVCTLNGSMLAFVGGGTCTITANQAGDATHLAAPQVTHDVNVVNTQIITFPAITPNPAPVGSTATVSATASSGLAVTYSSLTGSVCTVSGTTVSFSAVGKCVIAANQAGNASYRPAPQVTQTVNIDYRFAGFGDPVTNGALNVTKTGKTIPLKWRLTDASGAPITNLASALVTVTDLGCSIGTTENLVAESAAGNSGLQNLGNGNYQFNWKVPSSYANSCKTLQLDLGEGSGVRTVQFEFTK